MDEGTLVYLVLTLFVLNYVGIGAVWSKIDKLGDRITKIESCLIMAGCKELKS